ncbi:MAG: PEP-CTERM sorting domain-containing protein [Gemmatimonadaceae bacterium]|nr:PEP-CTERM sorting domain-containing protein [Acetobacteraceae bacterium]
MAMLTRTALAFVAALSASHAWAVPVVLNPNFLRADAAANATYNQGSFLLEDWIPVGYATNSVFDPGQYDNGNAGGNSVVGFLSGPGTSLSQDVTGFVIGQSYQVVVSAASRRASVLQASFQIAAGGTVVFGAQNIPQADPLGVFSTPFAQIISLPFLATTETVRITFENALGSANTASTLLTGAAVIDTGAFPTLNAVVDVPEPISLALLTSGLVALRCSRRGRAH